MGDAQMTSDNGNSAWLHLFGFSGHVERHEPKGRRREVPEAARNLWQRRMILVGKGLR
jgi:hypothetical protein